MEQPIEGARGGTMSVESQSLCSPCSRVWWAQRRQRQPTTTTTTSCCPGSQRANPTHRDDVDNDDDGDRLGSAVDVDCADDDANQRNRRAAANSRHVHRIAMRESQISTENKQQRTTNLRRLECCPDCSRRASRGEPLVESYQQLQNRRKTKQSAAKFKPTQENDIESAKTTSGSPLHRHPLSSVTQPETTACKSPSPLLIDLVSESKSAKRRTSANSSSPVNHSATVHLATFVISLMICLESSHCGTLPGGFLMSGHAIACKRGQPVQITDYIPTVNPNRSRCYSCSCPEGSITCGKIDDSDECMQPSTKGFGNRGDGFKGVGGGKTASQNKAAPIGRSSSAHAARDGYTLEQQQQQQLQHQQSATSVHKHPNGKPTSLNSSGQAKVATSQAGTLTRKLRPTNQIPAAPSATVHSGPIAQPIGNPKPKSAGRPKQFVHVKPVMGPVPSAATSTRDEELDEDESGEEGASGTPEQPTIKRSSSLHEKLFQPPKLPPGDPRHLQEAADALGFEPDYFLRKRKGLLQRIESRTSTTMVEMTTTTTTAPTTTPFATSELEDEELTVEPDAHQFESEQDINWNVGDAESTQTPAAPTTSAPVVTTILPNFSSIDEFGLSHPGLGGGGGGQNGDHQQPASHATSGLGVGSTNSFEANSPHGWPLDNSNNLLEKDSPALITTAVVQNTLDGNKNLALMPFKGLGGRADSSSPGSGPSSSDLIEQVSNDGMLIIAMGVEFAILLLIIVLIVVFYIYRDEPDEANRSNQHQLQSRSSPSLNKTPIDD